MKITSKQVVFLLLAFFLLTLMLGFRFCVADPLSIWGTYFLIIPVALFFSAALFGEKLNYTHLNAFMTGVIISAFLGKGSWADSYVLQRLIASVLGAIISVIIFIVWLKKKYY